jgi:hypothetical protein
MKKPTKAQRAVVDRMAATREQYSTRMAQLITAAAHDIAELESSRVACVSDGEDCFMFVAPVDDGGDEPLELTIFELRAGEDKPRSVFLIGDAFIDLLGFIRGMGK